MYENKSNPDCCSVNTYLACKDRFPADMITDESLFYLAINIESPKPGQKCFKCSPLGVNSLRCMLMNMIKTQDWRRKKPPESQHKKEFGSEDGGQ